MNFFFFTLSNIIFFYVFWFIVCFVWIWCERVVIVLLGYHVERDEISVFIEYHVEQDVIYVLLGYGVNGL